MRFAILTVLSLQACTGDKTSGTSGDTSTSLTTNLGPATMVLSFDLDADLIPAMSEPAVGSFRGSVFAEADASPIGPNDGAVPLLDFTADGLDFGTAGGVLADKATLDPIDPQIVWVLGCLDTTGDDCDCDDPITIPNENKFDATAGEGSYTLTMSLLNPC